MELEKKIERAVKRMVKLRVEKIYETFSVRQRGLIFVMAFEYTEHTVQSKNFENAVDICVQTDIVIFHIRLLFFPLPPQKT